MRSILVFCALAMALPPSLAGQDSIRTPRFVLAVGPSWDPHLTGVRVRAEHHLIRDRWFGLQVEAGGLWTPSQFFSSNVFRDADGRPSYWGRGQAVDFRLGAAATLSPFPRGRFSPYVIVSGAAVQSWWSGVSYHRSWDGQVRGGEGTTMQGKLVASLGLGIRARLANRLFRLELRREWPWQDLTLGTALPF